MEKQYIYRKLRARIVEKYGTLQAFADAAGITLVTVSRKMNCQSGFSQEDIKKWADLLGIAVSDYGEYFYV